MMRGPGSSGLASPPSASQSRHRLVRFAVVAALANLAMVVMANGAFAADKKYKVVVEQFSGPSAPQLRKVVTTALGKNKALILTPDKKVAATEADLGLIQTADNYGAVAKALKTDVFVKGKVAKGKKKTLKALVTVLTADGTAVGTAAWVAKNPKKLLNAVNADVGRKVAALIEKSGETAPAVASEGGGKSEAKKEAEAKAEADAEKEAEKVAEAAGDDKDDDDDKGGAKGDDDKKDDSDSKRASADDDDADAAVSARARRARAGSAAAAGIVAPAKWSIAIGGRFFNRSLTYNQVYTGGGKNRPPTHNVSLPALAVSGEFTPVEYVSVLADVLYTNIAASYGGGGKYPTSLMSYSVAARPQMLFGNILAFGMLGYTGTNFKVESTGDDITAKDVVDMKYSHIKVGAGARVGVSESLALVAGGNYLHTLAFSDEMKNFFPKATSLAGEAYAGAALALPFYDGLEARLLVDFRRIVFNLNNTQSDVDRTYVAGGAVDQYIGGTLQLAYRGL